MSAATDVADAGSSARSAHWVAAGILVSRITGLLRDTATAVYLGTSPFASIFRAALRMPNVLQNLLGEGTLSASFIPVYAELLEQGREEEAGRVAGAVFALVLAVAGGLALLGILLAPALVDIFLPGFEGAQRELTIASVRIIFPMTGVLVLSAWALGILNSHRRFFLPYVAPVVWNAAIIGTFILVGGRVDDRRLVIALAWGALVGGLLQFGIQLPWVVRVERRLKVAWDTRLAGVRTAVRNAGPAILGRGVVQLSGWVDLALSSLLWGGALAVLSYAQTFYMLPISLFGMSVAAAELPELARQRTGAAEALRARTNAGLRRIALLVVPSVVGYLTLGDVVVAALYQHGQFAKADTVVVALTLAGYAIGLLASTATRLFSSTFYALHDTRTPARIAFVRVVLAAALGAALMFPLERVAVLGRPLGTAGLSLGAGLAAWVEWALLRRTLRSRIGPVGAGARPVAAMIVAAFCAAALARALLLVLPPLHPILTAVVILGPYGLLYFTFAHALRVEEASRVARGALSVLRGARG